MDIKFLKLKREKRFVKGGLGIKPDLYWKYILGMSLLLTIGASIFGFFLFEKINKDTVSSNVDIDKNDTIKKERIDSALGYFNAREKKSIEILNSPSPINDPSF